MKKLILILILFPLSISAQQSSDFNMDNQANVEKIMESMQKFQACMMKIDEKGMEALQRNGDILAKEIQALCKKGKRDQAEQKAESAFKNMKQNPVAIKLMHCSEMMIDMQSDVDDESIHVCDAPKDAFSR